ncbi:MAG: hypothetical protein ABI325_05525 [Ginsengibacter sp.]
MMKILKMFLFFAVTISYVTGGYAQNDELPDSRKKTESFDRFHTRDIRADLATFTIAGISESVGAVPLNKISYTGLANDSILFEAEGIKAKIKIAVFDPAKHKLSFDDKYLVRIDRKPYYGDYGNTPKTGISEVSLIIDNDTVFIPPAAYSDLFNVHFTYSDQDVERTRDAVYKSKDGHKIYLYFFSKDDRGSYEVTWIIQDKKYLRRVLDYGLM